MLVYERNIHMGGGTGSSVSLVNTILNILDLSIRFGIYGIYQYYFHRCVHGVVWVCCSCRHILRLDTTYLIT